MAHWANQKPGTSNSGRKKWNLEDRSSLQNLKHHLAEDGIPEVQYALAKQLLADDSEHTSHAQGVLWLVKAVNQGHDASLGLLQECVASGKGINEENAAEVYECIQMTPNERAARRAAKEIFACLSNGGSHITTAQLERKLREIYKMDKRKGRRIEENGGNGRPAPIAAAAAGGVSSPAYRTPGDHISEAGLVSAAVNYSHGQLPLIGGAMSLSVPNPCSLDHIPYFFRPFFSPILFFLLLYHRFVLLISTLPGTRFSNLQIFIAVLLYSVFASESLLRCLPLGVYYVSFAVMVIASFKMLKAKHEFIDFRIWSGLFLRYDDQVDADLSESQFLRRNLQPYLIFFGAFTINLIMYPLLVDQWMPSAELTVLSFLLTFITLIAFMYTASSHSISDYYVLFSFGLNVLAKYPYEADSVVTSGWRFIDLKVPAFTTFVIGNGIEFALNCRALLYLLIPVFLLLLASRDGWRGVTRFLIPHCVTLSWLQICILVSQTATMFGLVRAALGLSGLLLFLPLFGVATLLIPVFAVIEWLSLTDPTVRLTASVIAASFIVGASFLMARSRRTEKYITALQVALCVVATVFLTFPYMTSTFEASHDGFSMKPPLVVLDEVPTTPLSWKQYYHYCHQPAWERVSKVKAQIRCSHLDGSKIHWEGVVTDVEVTRVHNFRATMIKALTPMIVGEWLTCFYGDRNEDECSEGEDCLEVANFILAEKRCNLDRWNSYEYQITVRMSAGLLIKPVDVKLKAQHVFGNFTERLNISDRLWFKGILRSALLMSFDHPAGASAADASSPTQTFVELSSMGCIHCSDKELDSIYLTDGLRINARLRDLRRGIKYFLNVLFNPLVTFK